MAKQLSDYKEGVFQTDEDKEVKVHICPKCRSYDVRYIFGFGNAFGIIPTMQCRKCNFKNRVFPLLTIKKSALEKANKEVEEKLNKKKVKK